MTSQLMAFRQLFPVRQFVRGQWRQAWAWLLAGGIAALAAFSGLFLAACVVASSSGGGDFHLTPVWQWAASRVWVARFLSIPPDSFVSDRLRTLLICLGVGIGLAGLAAVCLDRARRCGWRGTTRLTDQLRERVNRHAIRVGSEGVIAATRARQGGDAFDTLDRLDLSVSSAVLRGVLGLGMACLSGLLLLLYSPILAFECLVPLLVARWFWNQHTARLDQRTVFRRDHAGQTRTLLTEGSRQARLILGRQLEEHQREVFSQRLAVYSRDREASGLMAGTFGSLRALGAIVLLLLPLFFVAVHGLSPAAGAFALCEVMLLCAGLWTVWRSVGVTLTAVGCRAAIEADARSLQSFLDVIPLVGQAAGAAFLQPAQKNIEFDRVTCRHDGRTVLDELTLKIPAGSTTAIVSLDPLEVETLLALLPRFVDPDAGRILVDGQELTAVTLESARRQCLVISDREEDVLSGTVAENLEAPVRPAPASRLHDAAKRAHAHGFIMKLPRGYETQIGPAGAELSPGQRFRLAIAVGFLVDPPVIVIREPEGAVSQDDKALIDDAQRSLSAGRTVFVVPRRHATLRQADRVILISGGRIEAFGTHDALIETSETYRHWEYVTFSRASRVEPQPSARN